jgi:hypothetical protein
VESMAKTRETYPLSQAMLIAEQIKAHGLGPI